MLPVSREHVESKRAPTPDLRGLCGVLQPGLTTKATLHGTMKELPCVAVPCQGKVLESYRKSRRRVAMRCRRLYSLLIVVSSSSLLPWGKG